MDLKLSCPAVSHICSLTLNLSSILITLEANYTPTFEARLPTVTVCELTKISLVYLVSRQLLPDPDMPTIITLNCASSDFDTRFLLITIYSDDLYFIILQISL